MKLENFEFEKVYKGILKAEDGIITMQKKKVIDFEKKISQTTTQEGKTKVDVKEKEEKRLKEKAEFEEKIQNAMEDLQYLTKSKNLVTKNIKNVEDHLNYLKNSIEELQTQKYLLNKNKSEIMKDMKEYEHKLGKIDSDFKKFMDELNESNPSFY